MLTKQIKQVILMNNVISRNRKLSIGIVLCICGVSIGGLIKLAMGVNYSWISGFIIVLSVLALLDIKRATALRRIPWNIMAIFLYSIYTIILACAGGAPFSGNTISVVYQVVYFLQIILIWALHDNFDSEEFLRVAFWIIGISAVATIILINVKGFGVGYGVLISRTDDTSAVSRATTGFIAYYGLCASMTHKPKNKVEVIFRFIFFIVSLVVLVMSSRRSTILAFIVILVLYYRNHNNETRVDRKKIIRAFVFTAIAIIAIVLLIRFNSTLQIAFNRAWNSLINGFNTYLGNESSDMSAGYRRARIESIPHEYLNNSTLIQFLFGRGYNTDWLDIPFLQAFWDLGLFGGIWFLYIQGIAPLRHVIRKPNNSAVEFAQYYTIFRIIQNFSNGTPYGNFLPIVLLYTFERTALTSEQISDVADEAN